MQIFLHSLFGLFNLGNADDYLNVVIKDGGISVQMKVTTGKLDMYIKPNRVRFDDYRWHKVSVHRRIKEVSFKFISIISTNSFFVSVSITFLIRMIKEAKIINIRSIWIVFIICLKILN